MEVMVQKNGAFSSRARLGKKGQLTLPKRMRDEDSLIEGDEFAVVRLPSGDIILQKIRSNAPENRIFDAIGKMPDINWRQAWKEVESERARERP